MPFQDFRVQLLRVPAPDCGNPIAMMTAGFGGQPEGSVDPVGITLLLAVEAHDFLAVLVMDDRFRVAGDYDVTILALNDVADPYALVIIHLPTFTLRRFV